MSGITRRGAGQALVGGVAALGLPGHPSLAAPKDLRFPTGFKWGCATAAYQVEGAVGEDGRGSSIWDVLSHTPGKIKDGQTGDVACDSYHRFREDSSLLKNLGANAYRFSIAWPRIFPQGRGRPNPKGIDHYSRVIDDLLEKGIEPYVTLFHWDLPAALPGGWRSRDTASAFADYAAYVVRKLGDRVKHVMTMNEMRSFVDNGYGTGEHAPGLRLPRQDLAQVRHHALLAHGLGVQAIRAISPPGLQIGLAENPTVPVPVIETDEHVEAARKAMRHLNAGYLTAVLEGSYLDSYTGGLGGAAPKMDPSDLKIISTAVDFVAMNVYSLSYVRSAQGTASGFAVLPPPPSFPRMALPWLNVGPEALYWAVRLTSELWKPRSLYISENGTAAKDRRIGERVDDSDRVMFLRNYITHLHRAAAENYPIHGYFLWSLLDNFEWAEGFTARFGIHYTDFATQRRIPKLSAAWYKELITRNRLV